ncbi:UDP-2,4-diacetamido-2,4,6-trideoxy-beta-L-altropyranose hydrolase [Bradyrhizobium cenepequi]
MSAIQRIVIRADASATIGMGHLTRCMSLANALAQDGAKVVFLLRSHAAVLAPMVKAAGHAVRLLPDPAAPDSAATTWLPTTWQRDAEQTLEALREIGPIDWLIVDHYALDARWEGMQRQVAPRILVIDDIANRPHDCDVLLDQNLASNMDARYEMLLSSNCWRLLGPHYALLRPEFAIARRSLPRRTGEVRHILICFGGSDPSDETTKALAAIKGLSFRLGVDVAIGMSNPNAERVAAICRELPSATLHYSAKNMAELMGRADLAIGAGGVMCWERCCLGLPTMAVDIAENQVDVLRILAELGALLHLGSAASVEAEQIRSSVSKLAIDAVRMRTMGDIAFQLVDGEGTSRVVRAMKDAGDPTLRP